MKLFKNFKTKKQLRAEIERLKAVHERPPIIEVERKKILEFCASVLLYSQCIDGHISQEDARRQIEKEIFNKIAPFIEYSMDDDESGRTYRGMLRLVEKGP